MVPDTPSTGTRTVSRRRALAALGAGALAATAGCAGLRDAVGPLRRHVHRSDADLSGDAGPWPTRGADARRSGTVAGRAPPEDAVVSRVTTVDRYVRTQPAIVGGRAYVGADRRTTATDETQFSGLVAVDLDAERPEGRTAWRAAAGGPTTSFTPTVAGHTVVAPLGEGVKALDRRDGTVRWRTTAGGGTTAVVGGTCYTYADRVVALDAVTGERRWQSEETAAAPTGFAVVKDAVALACGDGGDGSLYCFDRTDGATRWRYAALGESYASAVVDDDRAYAVSTAGVLHAVTLDGGERAWTHAFDGESYRRVAVADGVVYAAGTNDDAVVALDAATGERRWRYDAGIGGASTPAVTPDSVLVVAPTSEGRRLLVLDRASGAERYRFALPAGLFEEVQPVVRDGVAYVPAEPRRETQGYLYAVH
ncbi:MAG: PQQ-binding-like beta-propeller repeat protein [Haloferacaceae archaeon]